LLLAPLLLGMSSEPKGAPVAVTLRLDRPGPAISPLIFGVNFPKDAHRTDARVALERWGGNRWTRFDWRTGNDAAGHDWFFANGGQNAASPDDCWYHAALERNRKLGIETIVTLPTIGWVAKDNHSASFPVSKYGPQKRVEANHPDWGNGETPDGKPLTADPAEAGKPAPPAYIGEFVKYLREKHGPAGDAPRRHYALDNEPGLWNSNHRDVHPEPLTYDEAWKRTVDYANAVKDADSTALVWGPVEWGWIGIKYSAADKGPKSFADAPDSKQHKAKYFLEWYIQQLAAYKKKTGRLLVDVIDIHDYPEIYVQDEGRIVMGNKGWNGGDSPRTQRARLDAVRTWWEPGYRPGGEGVSTWIDEPEFLLRRVQGWIKDHLPELKLAVTEWNFGGNNSFNGTLVHALIFQTLMQEGAYAAAEWGPPGPEQPSFHAYRLFRNYDGKGGSFSGVYVPAESGSPLLTVFGALDESGRMLRLAVVNTDPANALTARVAVGRAAAGRIRTFRLAQDAPSVIRAGTLKAPATAVAGGDSPEARPLEVPAPASSLTLVEYPL
ncbi:MAG: glycoside hydrolase family 44 protein, partial [bacterium]